MNNAQNPTILHHSQRYQRSDFGTLAPEERAPTRTAVLELTKPTRLRRSRSVRSSRPRALTRAIERGADPRQAVTQWQACGGSMEQLRKNAQARR
jgi:hypothetical protein